MQKAIAPAGWLCKAERCTHTKLAYVVAPQASHGPLHVPQRLCNSVQKWTRFSPQQKVKEGLVVQGAGAPLQQYPTCCCLLHHNQSGKLTTHMH